MDYDLQGNQQALVTDLSCCSLLSYLYRRCQKWFFSLLVSLYVEKFVNISNLLEKFIIKTQIIN